MFAVGRGRVVDNTLKQAVAESPYFELEGTTVTAVKPGGNLKVDVKDANVKGKTATITLKSAALEGVKNLKAASITDQYIDVQFTHTGFAKAFRIDVTDARGSVVCSVYAPAEQISTDANTYICTEYPD